MCDLKFTTNIDNLKEGEIVWLDEVYEELGLTLPKHMQKIHYWDTTGFHNIYGKPLPVVDYYMPFRRKRTVEIICS